MDNITINPMELESYECENCGGVFFESVKVIKLIPALMIGNAQPVQHLLDVPRCCACQYIQGYKNFLNKKEEKLPSLIRNINEVSKP